MMRGLLLLLLLLVVAPKVAGKTLRVEDCAGEGNKTGAALGTIGCLLCWPERRSLSSSAVGWKRSVTGRRVLSEVKEKFDEIYSKELWGREGGGSGIGSDPDAAYHTGYLIELLMYKYGLTSLLDAPCGAVHSSWTREFITRFHKTVPCFRYRGVDAAASVISKNKEELQHFKWASFSLMDLSDRKKTLGDTHKYRFDMILSRDALQHLSYNKIAGVLHQYCAASATYLLLGSYLDAETEKNENIDVGNTFCINVRLPPFSFPKPLEIVREAISVESRKYLLLYQLDKLCADQNMLNFIETYA